MKNSWTCVMHRFMSYCYRKLLNHLCGVVELHKGMFLLTSLFFPKKKKKIMSRCLRRSRNINVGGLSHKQWLLRAEHRQEVVGSLSTAEERLSSNEEQSDSVEVTLFSSSVWLFTNKFVCVWLLSRPWFKGKLNCNLLFKDTLSQLTAMSAL